MTTKPFLSFTKILLFSALILGGCSSRLGVKTKTTAYPMAYGQFPTKPVWVFEAQERVVNTPVVQDGRVFVRTEKAIYALDAQDGTLIWRSDYPAKPDVDFPQIALGDVLVVPGGKRSVVAYSPDNGKILWEDHIPQSIGQFPVEAITFLGDLVYVARFNSSLVAYGQNDGHIYWEESAPSRTSLYLSTYQNTVYFAAKDTLKGYDAVSGKLIFEKKFDKNIGPLLIENDILYLEIGSEHADVMAIDLNTFRKNWEITPPDFSRNRINSLMIYGETLLVNGDAFFTVDKSSGRLFWSKKLDEVGATGHPVVLDDRVYVRIVYGPLLSLNLDTGDPISQLKLKASEGLTYSYDIGPAVFKDLLIVPYGDNRVFAYRP